MFTASSRTAVILKPSSSWVLTKTTNPLSMIGSAVLLFNELETALVPRNAIADMMMPTPATYTQ